MASYNSSIPATVSRPAMFGAHMPMVDPTAPAGTFAPGTKIQVGSQKVVIQKYFSEGGFAHVYLVKMPKPIDGTDIAVLKRVAVPDKEHLANMRTEVETMKKLKGHRPIVTYYDSHASQLKGGGYEVFLLMEFCNGGGLIDFMNTRLQNRLTEPEILKIFSDVAEGVACMHYLKPPLLHRDLKVENVLITITGGVKRFKLCDFGSTAPPRPAATTPAECRLIEDDVQKHTTLQYRSPEMIDVYRKQPIDEKSDIWALGVLLYKLCYYTTPFEAQGQLAILNASFKFPAYPVFSDKLKKLIAYMLKENPKSRPNIYQVLREACLMQGIDVPIKDIYANRTQSESRRNQQLPTPENHISSPPVVGAVFTSPPPQQPVIPDVVPMRRGRPAASSQGHASKPSPSPMRVTASDPFAALDSKSPPVPVDELSSRFPSLDQFSLMHNGGKFDFDAASPTKASPAKDLGTRVTEKLADDAFAVPPKPVQPIVNHAPGTVSRAQKIISSNPELQAVAASPTVVYQPTPTRTINSSYVSHGTMTSPTPPIIPQQPAKFTPSPVNRFPASDHHRSASLPRNQEASQGRAQIPRPDEKPLLHPASIPRSADFTSQHTRHASSSRPSLEGGRPSSDSLDPVARTKSSNSKPRPASAYVESNIDYLREKESRPPLASEKRASYIKPAESIAIDSSSDSETNIESNVDFLKTMEDSDTTKKDKRRSGGLSHKPKRSSLPSLSGTKNLLAGKFGDAFKRFEHNAPPPAPRTPSPLHELGRRDLTPIAGSEATDGRSDDGNVLEDMDGLAPEQRREIERRRLSMEEQRVANAAAEYRRKIADRDRNTMSAPASAPAPRSIGGVTRAASIQNKVKNLLDESYAGEKSPRKTADGYGRYTDHPATAPQPDPTTANTHLKPAVARKPVQISPNPGTTRPSTFPAQHDDLTFNKPRSQPQSALPPAVISKTGGMRPSAPPKPVHLNSTSTGPKSGDSRDRDDYVRDFSKRFPSLEGIGLGGGDGEVGGGAGGEGRGVGMETVQRRDERDWDRGGERVVRTKEV